LRSLARRCGTKVWHDTLEDTTLELPDGVEPSVRRLVEELTFSKSEDERVLFWQRSREAKLLKLYDKVSNLLDNRTWRRAESWNAWAAYTLELARFVEAEFGRLNIVRIAHALADRADAG
jgi:hypothetical protein